MTKYIQAPYGGIYRIKCRINDRFYIGHAKNITKRIYGHSRDLRNGLHCNRFLQADWKKYGLEGFSFKVLFKSESQEEREQKEREFIAQSNHDLLYNFTYNPKKIKIVQQILMERELLRTPWQSCQTKPLHSFPSHLSIKKIRKLLKVKAKKSIIVNSETAVDLQQT